MLKVTGARLTVVMHVVAQGIHSSVIRATAEAETGDPSGRVVARPMPTEPALASAVAVAKLAPSSRLVDVPAVAVLVT